MQRIKTFKEYKQVAILKADKNSVTLNFNTMNYKTYVYRITNINKKIHYYGSRTTKTKYSKSLLEDLTQYKSSSTNTDFQDEQISHPENFKYKIIKEFNNIADCLIYESYLHQYFNVAKNKNFYNKANARISHFCAVWNDKTEEENIQLRNKISKSVKNTMSKFSKDKKQNMKRKELSTKKNWNIERKKEIGLKISTALTTRSDEEKRNTSIKMSKSRSGEKNYQTQCVAIYNHHNILIEISNKGIGYLRKKLNISADALRISYKLKKHMYENKANRTHAINRGLGHQVGWHLIKPKTLKFIIAKNHFNLLHNKDDLFFCPRACNI